MNVDSYHFLATDDAEEDVDLHVKKRQHGSCQTGLMKPIGFPEFENAASMEFLPLILRNDLFTISVPQTEISEEPTIRRYHSLSAVEAEEKIASSAPQYGVSILSSQFPTCSRIKAQRPRKSLSETHTPG